MKNNQSLSYEELLRLAQAYCTKTYSALFHSKEHRELLPGYLAKFLRDGGYRADGMDEETAHIGKGFLKSFAAVCMEGAIIVLAWIIYSMFSSSPPSVNPDAEAVTQVWTYIGELIFSMLVMVGTVKMSDRVVKDMMGL